jgi:phenylacetate-coenzyme A ligase PaaK-like adenylate-forming protein
MIASAGWHALLWGLRNRSKTPEELLAHNLARFRKWFAWTAARSPYYADVCRRERIDPATARPQDLPILTKRDLIENFDRISTDSRVRREPITAFLGRSRDPRDLFLGEFHVVHSSGTSGEVCFVVYSRREWVHAAASFMRVVPPGLARRVAFVGAANGHYAAVALATAPTAPGLGLLYRVRAFHVNRPTSEILRDLDAFAPSALAGYAGALRGLAEAKRRGELRIRPSLVVSSGEVLLPQDRAFLGETFGVPVRNLYASTEHLYMAVDLPAEKGEGMYLLEDDLMYELRDDCTLVTNLFNHTVPLLRYRMDDVLRPALSQGRMGPYRIVETLVGRREHAPVFVNARGQKDSIHPIVLAEFYVRGLAAFQFRLTGEDSFRFLAQMEEGVRAGEVEAEIAARLRVLLGEKGMGNVRFEIERVPKLPPDPETGKFRLIVPAGA